MRSKPKGILLFCFLIAGIWAGSVITYTINHPDVVETAEVRITDTAGRLFNRGDDNRTQPYDSQTAPPLNGTPDTPVPPAAETPVPEGMAFPPPATPPVPPTTAPATPPAPTAPTDMLNGVLDSVTKLFNGDGNFSDILNIGMALFAIFGGGSTLGSDGFFKIILGLFSKKASFNDILKERLGDDLDTDRSSGGRSRRRRRNR